VKKKQPLTTESEWTFDLIHEYYVEIERIAKDKFGLDFYPNQIEIISSEQMLDAYASVGMPINYNHWSFGKDFINQQNSYNRGRMGLAYEIVINSNPCIAYLMEENTMMMQVLVLAHANLGHNSFFKNNYLFKQWTNADSIIDYLVFAKKFISSCEEKYGVDVVEEVIDSCHALQHYGVDKYKRPPTLSAAEEEKRRTEREEYIQSQLNDIWRTIPTKERDQTEDQDKNFPSEPQENILYFIEKNAPNMETWKREILRIVRKLSQYFYPQMQTKVMNEGWATFWHYTLVHELFDEGLIDDGFMLEFYTSHTGVVNQLPFNSPYYNGINPYAIGFTMFNDIKRIAMEPTNEDKEWFGDQWWVGCGDWNKAIHWAMENFKDESFIQQFLSPAVMREMKFFSLLDDDQDPKLEISAIHDSSGYKHIRDALASQYNVGYHIPDIQIYNVDRWGDRSLTVRHFMINRQPLDTKDTKEVLKHLRSLWGFDVRLQSVDPNNRVKAEFELTENETLLDIFLDFNEDTQYG